MIVGWMLAGAFSLHGGDTLAADRPVFCGTGRWQPFVREAADRFRLPADWIDAVILAESAGCETVNGKPTISRAGAMGLMQLMPPTWREYRERLGLGNHPFNPRDNILAGAAYLRDLYNRFGPTGFLAAYQAGPGRYQDFLESGKPLPRVTREYVARVRRAIRRMDAGSEFIPQLVAPAASELFVNLSGSPAVDVRPPRQLHGGGLFVPLARRQRSAQRSAQRVDRRPSEGSPR